MVENDIEDLFDWTAVSERAMQAIAMKPLRRGADPQECLDHYCCRLLEHAQAGEDLWAMLWAEARRAPRGEIASATFEYRADLLGWATERVEDYQRRGAVVTEDPESIAVAVLAALEALLPAVRADPRAAVKAYRATRDELLIRYLRH